MKQEIGFCRASDGANIAYARTGAGPPLVKAANWLNHLEYDWQSPVWRPWLRELSRGHELIRYDERGNGLSDREVEDISFEAFVQDLEAVVEALALDRFDLLALSQGCAVSVAYAVRHPDRVNRLVLYGGYARGRRQRGPEEAEKARALVTLIRQGWAQENPAFRQLFTSSFIPGATPEQMQWFNDLQRITTSPENACRIREACDVLDVTELLPRVEVPTLVFHCRDDAVVPFDEGRFLAASIPGARFVPLESPNHLLLETEPAWRRFQSELRSFLGGGAAGDADRWGEEDRLLAEALDRPPGEREAWLEEACKGDRGLEQRVRRLLEHAEKEDDGLVSAGAFAGPLGSAIASDLARPSGELEVGDRLGIYEVLEVIGIGGMGRVYRARHTSLEREVAVKAVSEALATDPSGLRRFEREAKLLASLNHPNIATVHDFLNHQARTYLILELVEGETLQDLLSRRGPLRLDDALPIASQLVDAIEQAHRKGIVHRDLKPANVKLTPEGRVKVLDFGLAKLKGSEEGASGDSITLRAESEATRTGMVLGTPGYMSPEQARGEIADPRADVWAFGCILYEMLAGVRAFRGDTASEAMASLLRDPVDWRRLPSRVPAPLRELLRNCLEKDRRLRLQDIAEARVPIAAASGGAKAGRSTPSRIADWLRRFGGGGSGTR